MEIDATIKIKVKEGVYPTFEDSYFLIECIEVGKEKALDMGTGTGIIALHMAKKGAIVTAADKDVRAVVNAKENAEINGLKIKVVQSDLFSNIDENFDTIVFNPPYLPSDEINDIAWNGGKEGIEVAEKFLEDAINYLNPRGRIYLLLSTLGNIKKFIDTFDSIYTFEKINILPLFFEKLVVYKITH